MSLPARVEINSPGSRRVVPYRSSAAVQVRSSLIAVRIPRRISEEPQPNVDCAVGLSD